MIANSNWAARLGGAVLATAMLCVVTAKPVEAASATIADGTLANSANAQNAVGIFSALPAAFDIANGPLTFSGTLDVSNAGAGDYNIGLIIGTVYFLVHPGFGGGAFRYDTFNVNNNLVSPFSLTSNINIGYTLDASPIDYSIVLTDAGSGNFGVSVDITQGASTSTITDFLLAATLFGTGGSVDSFGVMHNGTSPGRGPMDYSNVQATTAAVPLPASLAFLLLGLGATFVAGRESRTSV